MSRLDQKPVGTIDANKLFLMVDETTGKQYKVTAAQLQTYLEGGGGGGGDVTAPTVVSATVQNAAPNQVVVVFSESVTVTTAGWSFRRNASAWAISSVAGSGTTWTFTMATSAANGETLDRSYDSGTGATVDGSANELASFTNSSVTNNVSGGSAPTITAKGTPAADQVYLTFNEAVTATNVGYTFKFNGGAPVSATSISGSGTTDLTFTFPANTYKGGDTITFSYDPATGNTLNGTSVELATQTDVSITNTLSTTQPTVTAKGTPEAGKVYISYDIAVVGNLDGFTFKKNGGAATAATVVTGSGTQDLTFTMGFSFISGDTLTYSYDPGTGSTRSEAGNIEIASQTDSNIPNTI